VEWDRGDSALAADDSAAVSSAPADLAAVDLDVRDSVSSAVGAKRVAMAIARASVGLAVARELLGTDRTANVAVASVRASASVTVTADLVPVDLQMAEQSAQPMPPTTRRRGGPIAAQVSAVLAVSEIHRDRATAIQIAVADRIEVRTTAIRANRTVLWTSSSR
jgi:hypothetical protein